MKHRHIPTYNRPPRGEPERCRVCAAVIQPTPAAIAAAAAKGRKAKVAGGT